MSAPTHALCHLVDKELDLTPFHTRYKNDDNGAPAIHPAALIKIVLLAYSRGLMISSRKIEAACRENMLFIAVSGDVQPHYTTLAAFVSELGDTVAKLFAQVLVICDHRTEKTVITADSGYHSKANLNALAKDDVEAHIPDNGYRKRDERYADQDIHREKPDPLWNKKKPSENEDNRQSCFTPDDFKLAEDRSHCICPAGKRLYSNGSN